MKRLFVVHGWSGSSQEPMIHWLGEKGKELGYETTVLEMPNASVPTIGAWTAYLDELVMYVDENTDFIGHSIGCQAILRYLASQKGSRVGKVVLIAPWTELTPRETVEETDIARPWIENPIDFASIRSMGGNFAAIFSDNDADVPLEPNKSWVEKNLNAKTIVETGKGHFTEEDGVRELPSAFL
ncbi:MAG: alpha/beta hydrolase [Patescibacteria group bacterium]